MYSYLPSMIVAMVVFLWMVAPGDLLSIGYHITEVAGYDAISARENNQIFDLVGAAMGLGIFFGVIVLPLILKIIKISLMMNFR